MLLRPLFVRRENTNIRIKQAKSIKEKSVIRQRVDES